MQHLPHPNNIGGRLFTDRRHNINNTNTIQCLKCPRCDSSNTKFCYYNNYNLSQPRHFCKNCRRYWTKGGVLRNVPVGGGCRKSKRANKPKQKRSASPGLNPVSQQQQSRSSSESSSNVHNASVSTVDNGGGFRVSDANVVDFSVRNSGENQEKSSNNGDNNGDNNNNTMVLSGEFMNLITNENNQFFDCLSNNSQNLPTTSFNQFLQTNTTSIGVNDWSSGVHQVEKDKIGGISDLTVTIEDLDWQHPTAENGSQGLFDFTSTIDHQNYWSQPMSTVDWSHNVNDHSLFLP